MYSSMAAIYNGSEILSIFSPELGSNYLSSRSHEQKFALKYYVLYRKDSLVRIKGGRHRYPRFILKGVENGSLRSLHRSTRGSTCAGLPDENLSHIRHSPGQAMMEVEGEPSSSIDASDVIHDENRDIETVISAPDAAEDKDLYGGWSTSLGLDYTLTDFMVHAGLPEVLAGIVVALGVGVFGYCTFQKQGSHLVMLQPVPAATAVSIIDSNGTDKAKGTAMMDREYAKEEGSEDQVVSSDGNRFDTSAGKEKENLDAVDSEIMNYKLLDQSKKSDDQEDIEAGPRNESQIEENERMEIGAVPNLQESRLSDSHSKWHQQEKPEGLQGSSLLTLGTNFQNLPNSLNNSRLESDTEGDHLLDMLQWGSLNQSSRDAVEPMSSNRSSGSSLQNIIAFVGKQSGHALHGASTAEYWAPAPVFTLKETSVIDAGNTRVVIPAAADPVQAQSLEALQALKVVEEGILASNICSRREYARWLIVASGVLNRNPALRIFPAMFIEGMTELAYDDVTPEDPDFRYIQGMAEAGLISSRLSRADLGCERNSTKAGCAEPNSLLFHPDSPVTRQDLISWKVALERGPLQALPMQTSWLPGVLLDAERIERDARPSIEWDIAQGEGSLAAAAFGFTRRFEPSKAVTCGQVATVLVVGEGADVVAEELVRLDAEAIAESAVATAVAAEEAEKQAEGNRQEEQSGQVAAEGQQHQLQDEPDGRKASKLLAAIEEQRALLKSQLEECSKAAVEIKYKQQESQQQLSEALEMHKAGQCAQDAAAEELQRIAEMRAQMEEDWKQWTASMGQLAAAREKLATQSEPETLEEELPLESSQNDSTPLKQNVASPKWDMERSEKAFMTKGKHLMDESEALRKNATMALGRASSLLSKLLKRSMQAIAKVLDRLVHLLMVSLKGTADNVTNLSTQLSVQMRIAAGNCWTTMQENAKKLRSKGP